MTREDGTKYNLFWAESNLGTSDPKYPGDYFAWGETEPKSEYSWSTYKWCNGSYNTMTKYCIQSSCGYNGFTDSKTELEADDDVATANWSNGWQMPSYDQFIELYNSSYTIRTWTTQNGVNGRKITSKSNGNSIFLPTAGFRDGTRIRNAGSFGLYWSHSLDTTNPYLASGLDFNSSSISTSSYDRYVGRSVRPVRKQ